MKKLFTILLLLAVQNLEASNASTLQFGNLEIHFPEKYQFTPLPSEGAMYGEGERSTVMVSVKSTVIPKYNLELANRIWNRNLKMAGMKQTKNLCEQKKGFIQCQKLEGKRRISLIFSRRQILTMQHDAKEKMLSSKDEVRISELQ